MPEVTVERRNASRYPMVLAADVVELPRGARLSARTSDISLSGCYIDTLKTIPVGSNVRLRVTHNNENFEAVGCVVYVSYGLGMGIVFTKVEEEERARLRRRIDARDSEF